MAGVTVVFDACVLYPAPLRDLLMRLATTGLFRARWSAAIHDEWTGALLATRPELRVQVARTRALMDAHVLDALVTGYEALIETIRLPDPGDRHVLAAAIAARAQVIVTKNLRDFPPGSLAPFKIEAQHPDTFVQGLLTLNEGPVLAAVARHRASLRNPPVAVEAFLETLSAQGMMGTVLALRRHGERI